MTGWEDFGSYPTGAPSDISAALYGFFSPVLTFEVVPLGGSLSGQALKIQTSDVGRVHVKLDSLGGFVDGEIVALLRLAGTTAGYHQAPSVRGDFAAQPTSIGIGLRPGNDDAILYRHEASENATIMVQDQSLPGLTGGDRYWARLNFDSTHLRARYWNVADQDPEVWAIDDTDPAYPTGSGALGFDIWHSPGGFVTYIEAVGWSDDPAVSAPTSGGGSEDYPGIRDRRANARRRSLAAWDRRGLA